MLTNIILAILLVVTMGIILSRFNVFFMKYIFRVHKPKNNDDFE